VEIINPEQCISDIKTAAYTLRCGAFRDSIGKVWNEWEKLSESE